ncbi:hypothetical protein HanRHA438_Chr16g0762591 [Helianthus annuus]|nr:hypothetical protein HanRHA438_Chr16g0762591 [Helianthus annuus]
MRKTSSSGTARLDKADNFSRIVTFYQLLGFNQDYFLFKVLFLYSMFYVVSLKSYVYKRY